MIETDIVVIDSGIDIEGIKGQKIIVGGVHIYEDQQGNIIKDEDYQDNFGHGSAVANMILTNVIILGISEPPVRTLRATIPENERHIFR